MNLEMSYTTKEKDGRIIISGKYIPKDYSCNCKECSYTIEVLKDASQKDIEGIVKFIEGK